jgi:hypothetical protein
MAITYAMIDGNTTASQRLGSLIAASDHRVEKVVHLRLQRLGLWVSPNLHTAMSHLVQSSGKPFRNTDPCAQPDWVRACYQSHLEATWEEVAREILTEIDA